MDQADESGEIELLFDDFDADDIDMEQSTCDGQRPTRALQLYLMFLLSWQTTFRMSDVGMNILLRFFAMFLSTLARLLSLQPLVEFVSLLPKNVISARNLLGRKDSFTKWVCCPKCSTLYSTADARRKLPDGSIVSKLCGYVRFPNHPQRHHRKPCGCVLLKTVRTSTNTTILYPRTLYCYQSLVTSLQQMLQRPEFFRKCEAWRCRSISNQLFADVYDGQIWKDFMYCDGRPFLAFPNNFMLSLNVDWFQPFKRTTYSCGAIYMAIQNLPRSERFLSDNIILVGVIPGPNEPKGTINSLLQPLVEELQHLWKGVVMKSANGTSVLVRAALSCVTCDIPAARKVCGFVGHNARLACSKCLKVFPTESFGQKSDYSGFNRSTWEPRKNSTHRQHAYEHKSCNTGVDRRRIEREYGCRYSVLLELPYFDPVRMCVVDPMHNLLLGTAKHMLSIWTDLKLLTSKEFMTIQDHVDRFLVPNDIGRIPGKIASGFSGFTAEQYRNWTLIFSLSSLKGLLPHQHFDCWHLFVKACHLLCRRVISLEELKEADTLLETFCMKFEQYYGKKYCNMNLHLHGHLQSCILDHGPVYSFWLFAFERLNGIMESFHTNNHDVSLQLMRRFLDIHSNGFERWPEEFRQDFAPLLESQRYNKGSLMQSSLETEIGTSRNPTSKALQPLPPVFESAFKSYELDSLRKAILQAKLVPHDNITVLPLVRKCAAVKVGNYILGSKKSRHATSSVVKACHVDDARKICLAEIQYFFQCDVCVGSDGAISFWFVAVSFYFDHQCRVWFGSPTEVWSAVASPDIFFLPLSCIRSRVAYCKKEVHFGHVIGNDSVIIAVPLVSGSCEI